MKQLVISMLSLWTCKSLLSLMLVISSSSQPSFNKKIISSRCPNEQKQLQL